MQIKSALVFHFTPVITRSTKQLTTKSDENVGKEDCLFTIDRMQN